jgi:hypothetical protein
MAAKRKFIFLSGAIIGTWTVIKFVPKKQYFCECKCGNKCYISSTELNRVKNSRNFGCKKCFRLKKYHRDLLNQKIGKLLVISKTEIIQNFKSIPAWKVLCDCGKTVVRSQTDLVRKNRIMSCGCLKDELLSKRNLLPPGESARNALFGEYKIQASKRNLDWELTLNDFIRITNSNCYYCGLVPCRKAMNRKSFYICNGIDRVDNSKGYLLNNCAPCCFSCNNKKRGISIQIAEKAINLFETGNPYSRPKQERIYEK